MQSVRCALISDFNITNFARLLENDEGLPKVKTEAGDYGQVFKYLLQHDGSDWVNGSDLLIVWTRPDGVIKQFQSAINYEKYSPEALLDEVDSFSSVILSLSGKVKSIFIPVWILPSYLKSGGVLDFTADAGLERLLMRMNLRLAENLSAASNVHLLNTLKWIDASRAESYNPKMWYLTKTPFPAEVFGEAVKDVKGALQGIKGNAKKLVILDLDETLWGGIVGDEGWEHIRLGGHDPVGEAFTDFQQGLKALKNRGVLLAIVSKNEEKTALEAIDNHPEMVLRKSDFISWKINWNDKAQNIAELVSELNLGLQSVVFIDDNPVERERVRDALKDVYVPEWPSNRMMYRSTLNNLRCFDMPGISGEDLKRTSMYMEEHQRNALKKSLPSYDEWLKTLMIKVRIEELNETNLQRTSQLLNKTNQMNLSTRRMSDRELANWANQNGHRLWTLRVSDKFGDSGLVGILSVEHDSESCKIVDFILSCRVMGRKVEDVMLCKAFDFSRSLRIRDVYARYIPTEKNKPCLSFFMNCMMNGVGNDTFRGSTETEYGYPSHIEVSEQ